MRGGGEQIYCRTLYDYCRPESTTRNIKGRKIKTPEPNTQLSYSQFEPVNTLMNPKSIETKLNNKTTFKTPIFIDLTNKAKSKNEISTNSKSMEEYSTNVTEALTHYEWGGKMIPSPAIPHKGII